MTDGGGALEVVEEQAVRNDTLTIAARAIEIQRRIHRNRDRRSWLFTLIATYPTFLLFVFKAYGRS